MLFYYLKLFSGDGELWGMEWMLILHIAVHLTSFWNIFTVSVFLFIHCIPSLPAQSTYCIVLSFLMNSIHASFFKINSWKHFEFIKSTKLNQSCVKNLEYNDLGMVSNKGTLFNSLNILHTQHYHFKTEPK